MPVPARLSCKEMAGALLADYHDGLLPSEAHQAVDEHIAVCPSCLNIVRTYSATTRIVKKALWTEPPAQCEKSLLEYLRKQGIL